MLDMDIETSWQYFSNQVSDIINETLPVHNAINPKKPKPSWLDKYCFKLIDEKYSALEKYTYPVEGIVNIIWNTVE